MLGMMTIKGSHDSTFFLEAEKFRGENKGTLKSQCSSIYSIWLF